MNVRSTSFHYKPPRRTCSVTHSMHTNGGIRYETTSAVISLTVASRISSHFFPFNSGFHKMCLPLHSRPINWVSLMFSSISRARVVPSHVIAGPARESTIQLSHHLMCQKLGIQSVSWPRPSFWHYSQWVLLGWFCNGRLL